MNKTKGVIIAIALLLLMGTGTFVFANPSLENDQDESTLQGNSSTIKKVEEIKENDNSQNSVENNFPVENSDTNQTNEETSYIVPNRNNTSRTNRTNNSSDNITGVTSSNNNSQNNNNNDSSNQSTNNSENTNNPTIPSTPSTPSTPTNPGDNQNPSKPTEPQNPGVDNPQDNNNEQEEIKNLENIIDDLENKLTKDTLTDEEIENAKDLVDKITNPDKKDELIQKIEEMEELNNLKKLIKELENLSNNASSIDDIKKLEEFIKNNDLLNRIENLEDSSTKDNLKNTINKKEELITLTKDVEELINNVKNASSKDDIKNAKNLESSKEVFNRVNNIENINIKNILEGLLEPIKNILNDITEPEIIGIKNKDIVNKVDISVKDNENVKIYIGNKEVTLEYINNLKTEGTYTIDFVDESFNKTTIIFTIDTTLPIITGIKNFYNKQEIDNKVNISINDSSNTTIYLYHNGETKIVQEKQLILDNSYTDGKYEIYSIDEAGNQSEKMSFEIDTLSPIINNIENEKIYNKNDMINNLIITVDELNESVLYIEKDGLTSSTKDKSFTILNSEDGNYKLWAIDSSGNTSNVCTFKVDTTAPIIESFGISNIDETVYTEVKTGDELKLYVNFAEELYNNPTIKVMDSIYEMNFEKEENGIFTYSLKYLITENTTLGNLTIKIYNYRDYALNPGSDISHTFENIKVVENKTGDNPDNPIDPTKPGFEFVNMKSFNNGNIYVAQPNYGGMIIHDNASGKDIGVSENNKYTTTEREYTLTQSGAYEFTLYDTEGKVILSATMIFDNVAPVIKATSYQNDEKVEFEENQTYEKVEFNITDDALSIIKYYKDGQEIKLKEYGKFATNNRLFNTSFTENGTYELVAIDRAGNKTIKTFTISKKQSLLSMIFSMI